MNPLDPVVRPFKNIAQAVVMPFKALFVVGLCALINLMTSPGHWWFQWVALGMGIAVVVALARGAKSLLLLALLFFGGRWVYRRYGAQAKAQFDAWATRTQPQAAQVVQALRNVATPAR